MKIIIEIYYRTWKKYILYIIEYNSMNDNVA